MTSSSASFSSSSDNTQLETNVAKTFVKDMDGASSPKETDAGATTAEGGSTPVAFTEPSRPSSPQVSSAPVDSVEHVAVEPQKERLETGMDDDVPETPEKEAAELEVAEQEAVEQEAAEQEAVEQEAAEQEAVEQEAAEQEAVEQEAAEQEAVEQEAAEQEAVEQEAAEQEAAEQEAVEQEAAEQEAVEQEAAEPEVPEQDAAAESAEAEEPVADTVEEDLAQNNVNTENPTNTEPTKLSETVVNNMCATDVSSITHLTKDTPEETRNSSQEPTTVGTVESSQEETTLITCPESKTTKEDAVQQHSCAHSQDTKIISVPSPATAEHQSPSAEAAETQVTESKAKEHLGSSTQERYSVEARTEMDAALYSNTVEILPLTLPCAMNPKEYLQEGLRVPYDAPPPTACPAAAPSPLDYATLRTYVSVTTPPAAPGGPVGPPLWHPTLTTTPTRVIDLPGHPGQTEIEKKSSVDSVPGSPVVRGFGCCGGRKRTSVQLKPASDAPEAPLETQRALSLDQHLQERSLSYAQMAGAHVSTEASGRFYPHPPPAAIYSRYYYVPSQSETDAGGAPVYRVHGPYSAALVSASGVLSETQQETEADGAVSGARLFDGGRSPTVYAHTAYSAPGQGVPPIWTGAPEGYIPMTADNFVPVSPAPSTTGASRPPRDHDAHDILSDNGATVVTATFPADQASEPSPTQASETASTGAPRKPVQKRLGTAFGQWLTASFGCCGTTRDRPATETPCQQAPTPFYMERQPSGCSAPASHRSFSYYQNAAETASLRRLDSQISAATSTVKVYPAGSAPAERLRLAMPEAVYPVMQQLR